MKFVAGLLFGAVAGAATAILLAPMPGRRLRESLSKEAKKLAVHASELVPREWTEIVEEEVSREFLRHVGDIRAAGL